MNIIKTIIDDGGFFDRGTLTLFATDCPNEQVNVEWNDGSRTQHKPRKALEEISMASYMGKTPNKVFLTRESLERLREMTDMTMPEIQEMKTSMAAREKLIAEHGDLFKEVSALLFRHDPQTIAYPGNEDEYDSEAATIIPRLSECHNAQDCSRVIHEEFSKWFAGRVRSLEYYQELGAAVFETWQLNKTGVCSN